MKKYRESVYKFDDIAPIRIALIGDKQIQYDVCSQNRYADYDEKIFDYIGEGYIYSIDGYKQTLNIKYHFWVRNSNHPLR